MVDSREPIESAETSKPAEMPQREGAKMSEQVEFPVKVYKPGTEWIVELRWREHVNGQEAVCGLFHSTDEDSARSFAANAERIISCWYVDQVFKNRESQEKKSHPRKSAENA